MEKVIEKGFIPIDVSWRKPNGDCIVSIDGLHGHANTPPHVVLPVGSLSSLLLEEVQKQPSVSIHWGHQVSQLGQDSDQVWVEVVQQSTTGAKRLEADFVIGCDGGTSNVRKILFNNSFPGTTWPIQLVAVNVSAYSQSISNKLGLIITLQGIHRLRQKRPFRRPMDYSSY